MVAFVKETRFCWICGKDISLEHCKTDEHGLSVHESCAAKRTLLKAARQQTESWRRAAQAKNVA